MSHFLYIFGWTLSMLALAYKFQRNDKNNRILFGKVYAIINFILIFVFFLFFCFHSFSFSFFLPLPCDAWYLLTKKNFKSTRRNKILFLNKKKRKKVVQKWKSFKDELKWINGKNVKMKNFDLERADCGYKCTNQTYKRLDKFIYFFVICKRRKHDELSWAVHTMRLQ